MKAIVTGSEGFIGKTLVSSLKQRGYDVLEIDIKNGQNAVDLELSEKVDEVYHLAATNGTRHFYEKPSEVLKNNTSLTFAFDEYLKVFPDTRFIFASTCEIFNGAIDKFGWEVPTMENVPAVFDDLSNPRWSYSLPKALAENYISNTYKNTVIVRYFNIFGEHQEDHFISEFIQRCTGQGRYEIFGNDRRAFCYVKDAAEMTINVGRTGAGTYNIGREHEISIEQVARKIMQILSLDQAELSVELGKPGSVTRRCPSLHKYNSEFGEYKYTDFDQALEATVKWYVAETQGNG